ncbi:hypothetical protein DPMN_038299 [Dreissena polymorpha]|uniref:Uncharacterized protein n=1 Tax=Dreissena polymorpha TaxID=45954 RepID=A0A9D4RQK1_DREPO|nr:hypothetical protein DPMN_038299 [Dreissena polymorpha]
MHKAAGACSSTDGLQRCVAYLFATCAHRLTKKRRMRNVRENAPSRYGCNYGRGEAVGSRRIENAYSTSANGK